MYLAINRCDQVATEYDSLRELATRIPADQWGEYDFYLADRVSIGLGYYIEDDDDEDFVVERLDDEEDAADSADGDDSN